VEKNYIVTSFNQREEPTLTSLTWADLYAADFSFNMPFQLDFSDHQVFLSEQVVRVIPKRRLVAFGLWQGKQVAIKIFFDSKLALQQMEKDIAGINLLKKNKIPTPELWYQGNTKDKKIYVLIFERLVTAKNLQQIWQEKNTIDEVFPYLELAIVEIATQHVLGLVQSDLHLKNFLLNDKTIYTLDGAQIEFSAELLPKKPSMNNLALFLAQLGIDTEIYQEKLFRHYAKARGWSLKSEDIHELFILIAKWNNQRWKKFAKKIFRDSSDYVHMHTWGSTAMYDRFFEGPELIKFLSYPHAAFYHPTAKLLKAGNSATVIKITLDQRELVIKRYNMKSIWHRLRRCLRETRARKCWRLAQKLSLFAISTPRPVAFIEHTHFGFRGKSYYVTEYVKAIHAGEYFTFYQSQDEKISTMIKRITRLLKNIIKLEITHGDLKITNILVDRTEQPVLIDLDGAVEYATLSGLKKAWRKEITRFLSNFHYHRSLREKFETALKE
jgi:tRNA A-37 threonylcarbamoyl transferase component Bud32